MYFYPVGMDRPLRIRVTETRLHSHGNFTGTALTKSSIQLGTKQTPTKNQWMLNFVSVSHVNLISTVQSENKLLLLITCMLNSYETTVVLTIQIQTKINMNFPATPFCPPLFLFFGTNTEIKKIRLRKQIKISSWNTRNSSSRRKHCSFHRASDLPRLCQ